MDHLWKTELQVWAYMRPATGYPATRAHENWTRNYTYLLSSHYTHKVFYSLPNWYSFAAMVPEHSTHTYCRNTVYQNRSEPNHSEGSKTTFLLQSALLKRIFFPVAVGLLPEQSTNSGRLYTKTHFSRDTLWVANAASLVRSTQVTHIEVYQFRLYIINIVFIKYYCFAIFLAMSIVGALSREYVRAVKISWKQCTRMNVENNPQHP